VICRIEQGDATVSSRIRARAVATLGGDFRLGVYPSGTPLIHDAGHARIVEAILRRAHRSWGAAVEVPVPGPGRRSTDVQLARGSDVVLVEVETHVRALEAILREVGDKRVAVAATVGRRRVHVVLALPATRHHRAIVRAHPAITATAFPVPSQALERAIEGETGPWPGDGILWQE
jgi:hypothetical protein